MSDAETLDTLTLAWMAQAERPCLGCGHLCPPGRPCSDCHHEAGAGPIICPICAYRLEGVREPRCPECGNRFRLDVRVRRRFDLPYLIGVVVMAMWIACPLGMAVSFWALVGIDRLFNGIQPINLQRNLPFILVSTVEILVGLAILAWWIMARRGLRRRPNGIRWLVVVVFTCLGLVSMGILERSL